MNIVDNDDDSIKRGTNRKSTCLSVFRILKHQNRVIFLKWFLEKQQQNKWLSQISGWHINHMIWVKHERNWGFFFWGSNPSRNSENFFLTGIDPISQSIICLSIENDIFSVYFIHALNESSKTFFNVRFPVDAYRLERSIYAALLPRRHIHFNFHPKYAKLHDHTWWCWNMTVKADKHCCVFTLSKLKN